MPSSISIGRSCSWTRWRSVGPAPCWRAGRGRRRTYDKADAQLKKSKAQLEADKAKLEQSRADYDINIDNAKAQVANAEAEVANAKVNLGYTRMYAPIAGRIGELKVKVGNLVGDGSATELVTIQQLDPMGLDFRPPARYLPYATALLSRGLPVSLTVEGDRVHPHVGKAIFIDNTWTAPRPPS